MPKVLVTGGAGFIGKHTVLELLDQGFCVSVLDLQERPLWLPSQVTYKSGNILDLEVCEEVCENVDQVVHLAAQSRSAPSIGEWEENLQVNILGTSNMLRSAKAKGVQRFVFASSSTVYGDGPVPQGPSQMTEYLNFYAWSKYSAEQLCLQFDRHFDLPCVALRYFSVYGPDQPQTGEYSLVMGIFSNAHALRAPVQIFGDGLQKRDFVHVSDVAKANVAALNASCRGAVLNVGSGTNSSVLDLAQLFDLSFEFAPERPGDARETLADISDTLNHLDWEPKISVPSGVADLKSQHC
jgi:UDP-glucose 4-epimerase